MAPTIAQIEKKLCVRPGTIARWNARTGRLGTVNGSPLSGMQEMEIYKEYAQKKGRRSDDTVRIAKAALGGSGQVQDNELDNGWDNTTGQVTDNAADKSRTTHPGNADNKFGQVTDNGPDNADNSSGQVQDNTSGQEADKLDLSKNKLFVIVLCVVYLSAMFYQMHHSASFAANSESPDLQYLGWVFAVAFQFTGLFLTLFRNKARTIEIFKRTWTIAKPYLLVFAVLEFLVNMGHYQPWVETKGSWEDWAASVLLSVIAPVIIYAYSEIFTKIIRT